MIQKHKFDIKIHFLFEKLCSRKFFEAWNQNIINVFIIQFNEKQIILFDFQLSTHKLPQLFKLLLYQLSWINQNSYFLKFFLLILFYLFNYSIMRGILPFFIIVLIYNIAKFILLFFYHLTCDLSLLLTSKD